MKDGELELEDRTYEFLADNVTIENIWNRPTESGTRWQTSGTWAVDADAIVRWGAVGQAASDIPDFEEALKMIGRK
jgi:hypothetical protein